MHINLHLIISRPSSMKLSSNFWSNDLTQSPLICRMNIFVLFFYIELTLSRGPQTVRRSADNQPANDQYYLEPQPDRHSSATFSKPDNIEDSSSLFIVPILDKPFHCGLYLKSWSYESYFLTIIGTELFAMFSQIETMYYNVNPFLAYAILPCISSCHKRCPSFLFNNPLAKWRLHI